MILNVLCKKSVQTVDRLSDIFVKRCLSLSLSPSIEKAREALSPLYL